MIESLKKSLTRKNILAFVIFGAIIIVFVFFGYQSSMSPTGGAYAARVNGTIITVPEFDQSRERLNQFYSNFLGEAVNTPEYQSRIKFDALNQLIQREMMAQVARNSGFDSSNAEIRDMIMQFPQFQQDGVFQRSFYENYLKSIGTTAGRFEDQLKKDKTIARLRATLQESFEPFGSELQKVKALRSKMYNLEYVKFDTEDFKKKISVSSDEISKFASSEENKTSIDFEFKQNYKDKKLEDVQAEIAKKLITEDKTKKITEELSLKVQNPQEFESAIQKYGLKWQKATPVSLDADKVVEIGNSEKLMQSIGKLSQSGDYIKEVISTPQGQFAIRLKSIETKAVEATDDALKKEINSQRANDFLGAWLESESKAAKIERNEVLFR